MRSRDLPSINCKVDRDLGWSRNCVLIEHDGHIIGVRFVITSSKLYVLVVNFSINDSIKFQGSKKLGFKRTISWNKYRSEITAQPKNNNLDYLIDPIFRNINRLFVLLFENGNNYPTRVSFDKYYMPLVEIKNFNALIDNKPFFGQPVKENKKCMKNVLKCYETIIIQQ